MKKTMIMTLLAISICSELEAKTLTIGIDLSGSNPLLQSKNFAEAAARYTAMQVAQLKDGDILRLQTFGARNAAENITSFSTSISRRNRAKSLANQVGGMILRLPDRTKDGQPATNIVAWLEFGHDFDCKSGGAILAITDALESSTYVNVNDLVTGKKSMPKPDVDLKQCELTFYGLGSGLEPDHVKNVRKAWQSFAEKAGANFTAIIP